MEKADNVNRRDRDKKAQPKEHTYSCMMGNEIDPIWDTFIESIYQNLTATGVEVTVRIPRKMTVQLRNEMFVQCSSKFFVTLLIAADEDCLVQSKRKATKYIIFFWSCQQQLFSHNWK